MGIADLSKVWKWGPEAQQSVRSAEHEDGVTVAAGQVGGAWPCVDDESETVTKANLLPLGFGLPLARLTARYFGGDVQLQSLVGHGTNAYIHIPELQQQTDLGD